MFQIKAIWCIVKVLLLAPVVLLFPRDRRKILFGAWWGNTYGDNSKYYLLYLLEKCPDYHFYWVGNESVRADIERIPNVQFVRKGSWLANWHVLTAKWAFWTISFGDDISRFPTFGRVKQLTFWHGPAFKGVTYPEVESQVNCNSGFRERIRRGVRSLLDWAYTQKAYASFSTEAMVKIMKFESPGSFDESRSMAFGSARIDYLVQNKANAEEVGRVRSKYAKLLGLPLDRDWILYMPTWRKGLAEKYSMLKSAKIVSIQKILEVRGAIVIEKQHPQVLMELGLSAGREGNIFTVSKEQAQLIDTQELLLSCQCLITDYSSCCVDFMTTERPIIHFMYDYDAYLKERGLVFDVDAFSPGPVVRDEKGLLETLALDFSEILARRGPQSHELMSGETGHACEQFSKWVGLIS